MDDGVEFAAAPNPALMHIGTEELLDELVTRSPAFCIAYAMPEDGDDARVFFQWGIKDFFKSMGLVKSLDNRMNYYDFMADQNDDDEEELEETEFA